MGRNAPPLAYNLRDYHGMGKGLPQKLNSEWDRRNAGIVQQGSEEFRPVAGRTQARVNDIERPPIENAPPASAKVRKYCSNQLAVKLRDIERLHQNLAGCHHVMIAGTYDKALREEMIRMGVGIIGPSDMSSPA